MRNHATRSPLRYSDEFPPSVPLERRRFPSPPPPVTATRDRVSSILSR